jgi:hypothetical protein
MELVNNIFYCTREETPPIKRSFLSIVMVVESLGIEELSPWISFVHHMLGALWMIGGIISFFM